MNDDRDLDKKTKIYGSNLPADQLPTLDHVKSLFIASGKSVDEIAKSLSIPEKHIQSIVDSHNLVDLRKAYVREGLNKIQNKQLAQAQELMDLEINFKKMRIIQLENQLKDYMAYYARHGDFYKRHPLSGEILVNNSGIPMQISLPNITKEVNQLKESVTLSEGMKHMLSRIDDILNSKPTTVIPDDPSNEGDIIDISNLGGIFESSGE